MRIRSLLLLLGSVAIGIVLIAVLIRISRIDLRAVWSRLSSMDGPAFLGLVVLTAVNTYISTQKWRLMDRVMRRPTDPELPRITAFTMTAAGSALGNVLPLQLSMTVARTLGTWVHGRALRRGTLGTLFEQGFDFLAVCFLMFASAGTRLLRAGAAMWLTLALAIALLALLLVGVIMRLLSRVSAHFVAHPSPARWRSMLAELRESGLLDARLGRRLMALSLLRFVVLVLMANQTTAAIHANIPLWQMAAAMPFVVFSTAIAITPGGLGINELTYATALNFFGTPLAVGASWSLANRILVVAATFAVAISAFAIFLALNARERLRNTPKPVTTGEEP